MPRHKRILSKTGIYHVMMRGNEKKNLFLDEEDKQHFLDTLFIKKKETGFFLYAYCLMTNHIHLLIQEGQESLATTINLCCGNIRPTQSH
jgi:putative transposase